MKALVIILVAAALVFGVYRYYFRAMPVTDKGTAPTQAIALTGVRTDLLQIAQAERGYLALNGSCVSLEALIPRAPFPCRTPGAKDIRTPSNVRERISASPPATRLPPRDLPSATPISPSTPTCKSAKFHSCSAGPGAEGPFLAMRFLPGETAYFQ
jgi:hypothetical protein